MSPPNNAYQKFEELAAMETDECVVWPHSRDRHGYGRLRVGQKVHSVHRLALERRVQRPRPDACALHLPLVCHDPSCMNYRHLYWGDQAANAADRKTDGFVPLGRPRQDACNRGHPYTPESTYVDPKHGWRYCLLCRRLPKGRARVRKARY